MEESNGVSMQKNTENDEEISQLHIGWREKIQRLELIRNRELINL
jgi:hypothetical protein